MTPAEHVQRIRQIELQLEIAVHGMGMPYDAERVRGLHEQLQEEKAVLRVKMLGANDNAAITGYDITEVAP